MPEDSFQTLDAFLDAGDRAGGLDFLIGHFQATGNFRLFFEAMLMKRRLDLMLPLIQTDSSSEFPPEVRGDYEQAMVDAARAAGGLALKNGDIPGAWPYFRAIGDTRPIFDAIDKVEPDDSAEQIVNIAFAEGVHPVKGLELILKQHGMCRAITTFGMYPVKNGRAECIALLAQKLHAEVIERMARTIEAQEGKRPEASSVDGLVAGRDWLFGEYDYYVDTSHLSSLLAYSPEVTDPGTLELLHDLCVYGRHLSPMFQSRGEPPFDNPYVDYDEYILAAMGNEVEDRLAHFRKKVKENNPDEVGTAPAQVLVNLAVRLGRFDEAVQVSIDHLADVDPSELSCPSTLQLCSMAKDYDRLKALARDRGDLLSYVAAHRTPEAKS